MTRSPVFLYSNTKSTVTDEGRGRVERIEYFCLSGRWVRPLNMYNLVTVNFESSSIIPPDPRGDYNVKTNSVSYLTSVSKLSLKTLYSILIPLTIRQVYKT